MGYASSPSCLAGGDSAVGSAGSTVRLLAASKRTDTNTRLSGLLLPLPLSPQQATADQHLSRRPSNTHRQVSLNLLWGHCSFPLGPGMHKILFLPSKSFCFPQSCGSSVIKSRCLSKLDSLGIPSLFARSPV